MSNDVQFALTTSLDAVKNLYLDANFEETENWIKEMIAPYSRVVVDPDDMRSAKDILAKIRRVKKSINDERISLEKQYMAPFNDFKKRVNDRLLELCAAAEFNLDGQLKTYERQIRESKFASLRQFFLDNIGDMTPYLTWDQIKNEKWGNATFSEESALAEIKQAIDMCADGVNAIRSLNSPFVEALLNAYSKNHDLAGAMKLNAELSEQKRHEDERKAAIEAAKATQERKAPEPVRTEPTPEKVIASEPTVDADKILTVTLQISGTNDQLLALCKYLDAEGLRFRSLR